MSGESNVVHWLTMHGHEPERPLVGHLFRLAKTRETTLTDEELHAAVRAFQAQRGASIG
jgi:hypothetical protein